jgi:hypothetical protein
MESQKEIGRISGRAIAIQAVANSSLFCQTNKPPPVHHTSAASYKNHQTKS